MDGVTLVLDASVGVKWFRPEEGSAEALGLLAEAGVAGTRIVAPAHFVHEVLSAVRRDYGPAAVIEAWSDIEAAGIAIVGVDGAVVTEASAQCEALGCSFYDSLAPALASLLDATLVSADARAHGHFPGVRLIG